MTGDQIFARQGADVVYGGRGADILVGRSGKDRLYGGRGDDMVIGRGGLNLPCEQKGRDCLAAEEQTRRARGDSLRRGRGRDHHSADSGDVILTAEVPNLPC